MARKNKINKEDLKEKKLRFEKIADNLEEVPADKFLKDNFLPYSWNFVLDRALVDVSGLKPVQRRILYVMYKDGLSPKANRSKVATLGGRVLAYHPHGNVSVEDALKNMARPHVFRVPLIDGKGDFGVPGTPGAASRYIEARLNEAAWLNVKDIGEHAVSMIPNYDETTTEPIRIPVRWPVSIINGGSGIAVGYSSTMPSHNPTEIMNACKYLLDNPDASHNDLQKIILGPDFNMGGFIPTNDGIKQYMETGSGTFKIRGQYEVIPGQRGTYRIEFYEIPFGTDPETIITKIQDGIDKKNRFKDIATYKDLSDLKHPIRLVIETKPSVNYKTVLQELFQYTPLESSFSANITTIVDNKPLQSSMKDLLIDFINFRKICIVNKTNYRLPKIENRIHLIDGLLITLLDIDAAIAIIRAAENSTVANEQLQKKFKIDEDQAEYVLSLQLRRLTKMDNVELNEERNTLIEEAKYLESLLNDAEVLRNYLHDEFDETLSIIGSERITDINSLSQEEFVQMEKEVSQQLKKEAKNAECYITRFSDGTLLRSDEPFHYALPTRKIDNSPIVQQIKVRTQDRILLIASDGIAYNIPTTYLTDNIIVSPEDTGLNMGNGVKLIGVGKYTVDKNDYGIALGTQNGEVKITKPDFPNKEEFPVFKLSGDDEIINAIWLTSKEIKNSSFVSITDNSNILVYDANSVRQSGAAAGGVRSQKLREDEKVISFTWVNNDNFEKTYIFSQATNTIKITPITTIPPKGKGSQGVNLHKYRKGETSIRKAFVGENIIISVDKLNTIINNPPITARAATGVDCPMNINVGDAGIQAEVESADASISNATPNPVQPTMQDVEVSSDEAEVDDGKKESTAADSPVMNSLF